MFTLQSGKHHGIADTVRSHPRPGSNSLGNIAYGGNNAHGGSHGRLDFESETFVAFDARQSDVCVYGDQAAPLDTDGHTQAIAFEPRARGDDGRGYERAPHFSAEQSPTINGVKQPAIAFTERTRANGRNFETQEDLSYSLNNPGAGGRAQERQILDHCMLVRRLTPRECERLQGLPDDFTLIPFNGKLAADGPRYRALGNAMAIPVVCWILQRIALMDSIR